MAKRTVKLDKISQKNKKTDVQGAKHKEFVSSKLLLLNEDFANTLKGEYKFKEEFNLLIQLRALPGLFYVMQQAEKQPHFYTQLKRGLKKYKTEIENLFNTLKTLPPMHMYALTITPVHEASFALHTLLIKIYDAGLRIPSGRSGKKNFALKQLIHSLADIFENGTGQEPTRGWDPVKEEYVGKFLDFATQCISVIINKNNIKDIGKFIIRALKDREGEKSSDRYLSVILQ